ncbi:MAG: CCA tRNA nucleotidyltransferase [Eubacteriales bacterium]
MQKLYLPPQVEFVIDRLNSAGFSAYAVGGCVRDHLMGRTPGDYDVTTSAKPDEMLAVFSDCRVIETGLKHGTITVLRDGMSVETTTYRIDGSYADGRHPDSVTFTSDLSLDLCRRDFTVNAMAYSEKSGIIDLFGGQIDLENRVIRCVGSADERFSEDGLRILRALRFSSVLDFYPDSECAESVKRLRSLLARISRERIYVELTKLLLGVGCRRILEDFPEVISFVLPQLGAEKVKSAAIRIESAPKNIEIRYAILLDSLEIDEASATMSSLKPSKAEKNAVMTLLKHKNDSEYATDEYSMLQLISKTDDIFPEKLADFQKCTGKIDDFRCDNAKKLTHVLVSENRPRKLKDLAIDGSDLTELGYKGAEIGEKLTLLLDRVMRGEVRNDRSSLLDFLTNLN